MPQLVTVLVSSWYFINFELLCLLPFPSLFSTAVNFEGARATTYPGLHINLELSCCWYNMSSLEAVNQYLIICSKYGLILEMHSFKSMRFHFRATGTWLADMIDSQSFYFFLATSSSLLSSLVSSICHLASGDNVFYLDSFILRTKYNVNIF